MILDYAAYEAKVLGCWMGKIIGGTLGMPFEWKRQVNNVQFFVQALVGKSVPNDDLDLQLVSLVALEDHIHKLDSKILAQYWLEYVIPDWVEYGIAKANLRLGLLPPLSGWYGNTYKDSCGAFIRSEIWACTAPGCPEIAAKFAYQDATIDHADEGVYAAIFCSVVESAAFIVNDKHKLIELGLSAIPDTSKVYLGIRTALRAYRDGQDWLAARNAVLSTVPPYPLNYIGEPNATLTGFDAPNNIAFMIIGWLYGEDDFARSLCLTVNCGDDTDCTAATLGAILGILGGISGIPEEWKGPMGTEISTKCINRSGKDNFPNNIYELTARVMNIGEIMLKHFKTGIEIRRDHPMSLEENISDQFLKIGSIQELLLRKSWIYEYDTHFLKVFLSYEGEPLIRLGERKQIRLNFHSQDAPNSITCQNSLFIRWNLPDGLILYPSENGSIQLFNGEQSIDVEIEALKIADIVCRCSVEIWIQNMASTLVIPFVLLNGNYPHQPYKVPHVA